MKQIQPAELKAWLDDPARERPVLLDVREAWETDICRIEGSTLIPMSAITARAAELDRERETVVICHHGGRSMQVALFLERQGFAKLHNLTGGVHAWAGTVDPSMETY